MLPHILCIDLWSFSHKSTVDSTATTLPHCTPNGQCRNRAVGNLFTLRCSLNPIIPAHSSELCLTAATVAQERQSGNHIKILEGGNDHDGFLRELNLWTLQYPFYNHPQAEHQNFLSISARLEFKSRPVIVSEWVVWGEWNSIHPFLFSLLYRCFVASILMIIPTHFQSKPSALVCIHRWIGKTRNLKLNFHAETPS